MTQYQYRIHELEDELLWQMDDLPENVEVTVRRNNQQSARLVIRRTDNDEEIVRVQDWYLTYGAQFGVEPDDVQNWKEFSQPFIEAVKNGTEIDKATMEEYLRFSPKTSD